MEIICNEAGRMHRRKIEYADPYAMGFVNLCICPRNSSLVAGSDGASPKLRRVPYGALWASVYFVRRDELGASGK